MKAKLLQRRIAQSKLALPVTACYAILVWMAYGLATEKWWLQFGCFVITTYLMMLLNNLNALIRIFSRMVSCSFLMLSCCACFLFPSSRGAILSLCMAAAWLILSQTYQDKEAKGMTYYGFLFIGLGSLAHVQVLYFVPLIWLLTATQLLSLSWRTWCASLFGLLTPYWFGICLLFYLHDFTPLYSHFTKLSDFRFPIDYTVLSSADIVMYVFLVLLTIAGIVHYLYDWHNDKIRIRLFYSFLIWTDLMALAGIAVQPQLYEVFVHVAIICTATIIGHFLALTTTKLGYIISCAVIVSAVFITLYNLWMS
jgi:hypothetical protein